MLDTTSHCTSECTSPNGSFLDRWANSLLAQLQLSPSLQLPFCGGTESTPSSHPTHFARCPEEGISSLVSPVKSKQLTPKKATPSKSLFTIGSPIKNPDEDESSQDSGVGLEKDHLHTIKVGCNFIIVFDSSGIVLGLYSKCLTHQGCKAKVFSSKSEDRLFGKSFIISSQMFVS